MNRRIRFLAALIALVGFTAYFAESVVAAACLPGAGTGTAVEDAGSHGDMHAGSHHAATAAVPSDASEQPVDSNPVGTHCPLAMPGGTSCTAAATLPTPAESVRVLDHAYHQDTPIVEAATGLMTVDPFFRPPRR